MKKFAHLLLEFYTYVQRTATPEAQIRIEGGKNDEAKVVEHGLD